MIRIHLGKRCNIDGRKIRHSRREFYDVSEWFTEISCLP